MHQGHQFRPVAACERVRHLVWGEDVPPRDVHCDQGAAVAFDHIGHAQAEGSIDADDDFISRLDEVAQTGFHASTAGARDRQDQRVLGAEDGAEQGLGLVH